jgi:hypothetical protein
MVYCQAGKAVKVVWCVYLQGSDGIEESKVFIFDELADVQSYSNTSAKCQEPNTTNVGIL